MWIIWLPVFDDLIMLTLGLSENIPDIATLLTDSGIDLKRRPVTLSLEEFAELSDTLETA